MLGFSIKLFIKLSIKLFVMLTKARNQPDGPPFTTLTSKDTCRASNAVLQLLTDDEEGNVAEFESC